MSALKEASEAANSKASGDFILKDGYGKFTVDNANLGESLFISVPADRGWKITRNGKVVTPDMIGNALMSVQLENGHNEIEMTYKVPYLETGLWASALGLLIFAAVLAYENINTRKPSKTHPAYKKHN